MKITLKNFFSKYEFSWNFSASLNTWNIDETKNSKNTYQIIFGIEHKYFYFKVIGDIGIRRPPDLRWIRPFRKSKMNEIYIIDNFIKHYLYKPIIVQA